MKASKRELREEWAERIWPTLEFWMLRSRISRRDFDVDALAEIVSKVRCMPACKGYLKALRRSSRDQPKSATPMRPRCSVRPHRDIFGPIRCLSAVCCSGGSAKHFIELSLNRDAASLEATMLRKRAKSKTKVSPTATDATEVSVPLGRGLLVHRIETCKHEGGRETLSINFPVKLTRRLNDPKALEPQRQLLVADLALVHRRHDEFPRLVLPHFVDGLRLGSLVRLFAYCHISSYTGDAIFMSSASPCTFFFGSVSRETPC
ncbi:conserved protein of unknown function (plasmid) [Caballeronia sp. S22]